MASAKNAWLIPAIAIVSLMGLFMWQLGIFNMGGSSVTTTGFAKIKPQLAATGVQADGKFNSVFTNGAGTTIYVQKVLISSNGVNCYAPTINPMTVASGENFAVSADGCTKGYPGDVYNMQVSIDYYVIVGGVNTTHSERGMLRGPIEEGYYSGSYSASRGYGYSGYYRLHKAFDFGEWWVIVILMSIFLIVESYKRLSKVTDDMKVQTLGVYSFIFLLCSTFIFIFGADNFFSARGAYDAPLRLKYGWAIESIIYFAVAAILLALAEYTIRKSKNHLTAIPAVVKPVITVLVLSLAFIYPFRSAEVTCKLSSETRLSEFVWILEVITLAIATLFYALIDRFATKRTGLLEQPEILYYMDKIAVVYFITSAVFFISGVHTLIYSTGGFECGPLLTSLIILAGGVILFKISVKKPEATSSR